MRHGRRFWIYWRVLAPALLLAALCRPGPGPAAETGGGGVMTVPEEPPLVALTFDDGPRASTTSRLLDGLALREIPATFFLVGDRIQGQEALVRRMAEDGHQIGVHSYDHSCISDLSRADFDLQVGRTRASCSAVAGPGDFWLRPPYGIIDEAGRQWAGLPHRPVVGGPGGLEGPGHRAGGVRRPKPCGGRRTSSSSTTSTTARWTPPSRSRTPSPGRATASSRWSSSSSPKASSPRTAPSTGAPNKISRSFCGVPPLGAGRREGRPGARAQDEIGNKNLALFCVKVLICAPNRGTVLSFPQTHFGIEEIVYEQTDRGHRPGADRRLHRHGAERI